MAQTKTLAQAMSSLQEITNTELEDMTEAWFVTGLNRVLLTLHDEIKEYIPGYADAVAELKGVGTQEIVLPLDLDFESGIALYETSQRIRRVHSAFYRRHGDSLRFVTEIKPDKSYFLEYKKETNQYILDSSDPLNILDMTQPLLESANIRIYHRIQLELEALWHAADHMGEQTSASQNALAKSQRNY